VKVNIAGQWSGMEWNGIEYLRWKGPILMPDHFRADQELKHVVKGIAQMRLKH